MSTPIEDRELLALFIEETRERLEAMEPALVELERTGSDAERIRHLNDVFRHLHSTKGSAGYLGLDSLVAMLHAAEQLADMLRAGAVVRAEHVDLLLRTSSLLHATLAALADDDALPSGIEALTAQLHHAAARPAEGSPTEHAVNGVLDGSGVQTNAAPAAEIDLPAAETDSLATTVRVSVDVLDRLGRLAEEMLVNRNRLTSLAATLQEPELMGASKKLSVMVSELQDIAASTRLQPIASLFNQMPRIVRDASRLTGKDVDLTITGTDLEVDRRILQELRDPLLHLLRNSVDHGVESSGQRIAAHKPERGNVRLGAHRDGSNLVVTVHDDGAGIDHQRVRAKAIERGFVGPREAAGLTERDLINMLLRPGFSTRDAATAISGRGVGMDVVATRMRELGGSLVIESQAGRGTAVTMTVPTSVSVMNTLVFRSRGYLVGVPYDFVQEIVLVNELDIESYGDQEVFRLRDRLVPLFTLDSWPDRRDAGCGSRKRYVLVLRNQQSIAGLWCDGIARFEELIVKPVGNVVRGVDAVTGLASLGTGDIVLILDPDVMLNEAGIRPDMKSEQVRNAPRAAETDTDARNMAERMILIQGYGQMRYALPVRLVAHIARFGSDDVVTVGNGRFLRRSRNLVPLVDIDRALGLGAGGAGAGIALLLESNGSHVALAAANVVRIAQIEVRSEPSDHPGVIGLMSLQDDVYLLIDVPALLYTQIRGFFEGPDSTPEAARSRVLLVEDSAFFRDTLEAVWRNAGLNVVTAESAEEAIEILNSQHDISLVVTDYVLPGKSGLDLVESIRGGLVSGYRDVPIIVTSQYLGEAADGAAIADQLRSTGADEVIAKFNDTDQNGLLAIVRNLLGRRFTQFDGADGAAQPEPEPERVDHLLSFSAGHEVFGVPVTHVREITTLEDLTPTPLVQPGLLGLANIRGEIIPVFDMGGLLERPELPDRRRSVDIVIVTRHGSIVLRCEIVRGTVRVRQSEQSRPTGNLGLLAKLVPMVAALPDCLLQILDLDHLAGICFGRPERHESHAGGEAEA